MMCYENENRNPNTAPETHALRKPLQRKDAPNTILSPTKRRKQNPADQLGRIVSSTPKAVRKEDPQEGPAPKHVLFEILGRLGVADVLERAAPTCRLWREVTQSPELWAIMRRHLRLVDQLKKVEKIVERRSKGRLFKAQRLGNNDTVLVRIVNLELTNAGKDDGVPTSFLREAALLSKFKHPNIVKFAGAEILGNEVMMCTEFVFMNFSTWYKTLEIQNGSEKRADIQQKFHQLNSGLSYLHHQGVVHRNLKPDNVFITEEGVVKLGDFTTGRMLDIPLQTYTPEDPKERDRSGREMRRLWYRAPELLLRQEIYGPKVDLWSVGCLLAEAAAGKPLFPSDSEIDHLFRIFRVVGTPRIQDWPEAVRMKYFSPKFPLYNGIDMAQVTRAVCSGSETDYASLQKQLQPDRSEVLEMLVSMANTLQADGMFALSKYLTANPMRRISVSDALGLPFFGVAEDTGNTVGTSTHKWLHGEKATVQELRGDHGCSFATHPELPGAEDGLTSRSIWNMLNVAQQKELAVRRTGGSKLPDGMDLGARTVLVDSVVGLAGSLGLTDYTLHSAVGTLDRYLEIVEVAPSADQIQLIGAACLKIADVFQEQSKEYYKQENAVEYAEATFHQFIPQDLISLEKEILPKLDFDLNLPSVHWFLKCYLACSGFSAGGQVSKMASFISDLTLLDHSLLDHPSWMRAQCALVLAAFLVQHSQPTLRAAARSGISSSQELSESQTRTCEKLNASEGGSTPSTPSSSGLTVVYLEQWDQRVRNHACSQSSVIDATMCLQAVVHMLCEKRRDWKLALKAVESKHAGITRILVYPESFPIPKLVQYILPDSKR